MLSNAFSIPPAFTTNSTLHNPQRSGNQTGHSGQKNLVSKHFIDLKHAHMADKKVSLFAEKKQKECWNLWNYNIHGPIFKSLLSSSTAMRERTRSADKTSARKRGSAWNSWNINASPVLGKYLSVWIVWLDLNKVHQQLYVMYLRYLMSGCLYWTLIQQLLTWRFKGKDKLFFLYIQLLQWCALQCLSASPLKFYGAKWMLMELW